MTQILTLAAFKAAALAKIADNRLAIQRPDELLEHLQNIPSNAARCMNLYPTEAFGGDRCHCIVGAALDDDLLNNYPRSVITMLANQYLVALPEGGARGVLTCLQVYHDHMVGDLEHKPRDIWTECRDKFLQVIRDLPTDNTKVAMDFLRERGVA